MQFFVFASQRPPLQSGLFRSVLSQSRALFKKECPAIALSTLKLRGTRHGLGCLFALCRAFCWLHVVVSPAFLSVMAQDNLSLVLHAKGDLRLVWNCAVTLHIHVHLHAVWLQLTATFLHFRRLSQENRPIPEPGPNGIVLHSSAAYIIYVIREQTNPNVQRSLYCYFKCFFNQ